MRDDFAVLILTHGRSDRIHTLKTLKTAGYTGKWYLVIDNEDDTAEQYYERFGRERVVMFDKQAAYDETDTADTFGEKRAVLFARNESFKVAKDLGLSYFVQFDDDIKSLDYRYAENDKLMTRKVRQADRLFEAMIRFLDDSDALTVAFCQGGDFIGGLQGKRWGKKILRKAMNSFFCRVERPWKFVGTMNEDVSFYSDKNRKGVLIMSITDVNIVPEMTQAGEGGMSEAYVEWGTYLKTFYSVMVCPSAVKVSVMNSSHKRIHHHVEWGKCAPMILNEKYLRKGRVERDGREDELLF